LGKFTKEEKSWMMYDWANSAYSIIITTAIFPIYFKTHAHLAGLSGSDSTAYFSYSVSAATFILAMLGPILGTIADYQGMKKKFFLFFFLLGTGATAALFFIPEDQWLLLLVMYVITAIGSSGSNLFYNAFIVDVTDKEKMDEVSSRGFALGYIGSVIPFVISIVIIILSQMEILAISQSLASRIAFLLTAIWWFVFTIPMIKNVKQIHYVGRERRVVYHSFMRLFSTFRDIRQYRNVFLFLLAYFFYIDGVDTIISLSTVYGTDVGLGQTDLILALLAVQMVAAPFSVLFGRLAKIFGPKRMLFVGIGIYTLICMYAMFLNTVIEFWILAMLVATSQGGIQALSRSIFAKMVPEHKSNEFFGFYNIFGRFAAVLGPFLVGATTQLTGSSSFGVLSLMILFLVGFALLRMVREPDQVKVEGKQA
jgi:Vacuole effluxer Atg22 like.